MSMVRFEFPLESGLRGVAPIALVGVCSLLTSELEVLQDAGEDAVLGAYTGLSLS